MRIDNLTEEELKKGKPTDNIVKMGLNQNRWVFVDDILKASNKQQIEIIIEKAQKILEGYK